MLVKPDVAAPGNKIVSLEANGSYLPTIYPVAAQGRHRAPTRYMQLSGTSMAAPMVSGGVALLLQGTPGLTPAQVKLALQSGATYVPDGGLMGAGAGSVNFWASRKITAGGLLSVAADVDHRRRDGGIERRVVLGSRARSAAALRRHGHPPALAARGAAGVAEPVAAALRRSESARPDQSAGVGRAEVAALRRGRRLDRRPGDHVGRHDLRPAAASRSCGAIPTRPTTTRSCGATR